MAELYGPPTTAQLWSNWNKPQGSAAKMTIPSLPSITGGASGPATSGGIGEQGNIGPVTINFPDFPFGGSNSKITTYVLFGLVAFMGYRLWKR